MSDIMEGTAEEIGTELVPAHAAPATLWRTDEPAEVLKRATETANALKPVLDRQGMVQQIQGRGHVRVEGWVTLGSMLGVTPVCTWTRKLSNPDGWEARVEARTLDGRVIGAAEAQCLKEEGRWEDAEDYARRSMAQTRATSKALGSVLRFVVTLAGYAGTPAEEMDGVSPGASGGASSDGSGMTEKQVKFARSLAHRAGRKDEDIVLMVRHHFGVEKPTAIEALEQLPKSDGIDRWKEWLKEPVPTGTVDAPPDMEGLTAEQQTEDDDIPFR